MANGDGLLGLLLLLLQPRLGAAGSPGAAADVDAAAYAAADSPADAACEMRGSGAAL